jgi:hypothetical protein
LRITVLSIKKKTATNAGAAQLTHSEPTELPASGSSGIGVGVGDGGGGGLGVLVGDEGVSVGGMGVSVGGAGVSVAVGVSVGDDGVSVGVGVMPRATALSSPNQRRDVWLLTLMVVSSAIAQVAFVMKLNAPTTLTNKATTTVNIKLLFIFHLIWVL